MTRPSNSRAASSARRCIILARAGRQLAAAARRAGHAPLVADVFGDTDTRALAARWESIAADAAFDFDAQSLEDALLQLQREAPAAPVVWGSGFEDRAPLLRHLATRCTLLGTEPSAVAAFAQPEALARTLRSLGIPTPDVRVDALPTSGRWLRKRRGGSGGGHVSEVPIVPIGDTHLSDVPSGANRGHPPSTAHGDTHDALRDALLWEPIRDTHYSGDANRGPPLSRPIGDTHCPTPWQDTHYLQAYSPGRSLSVAAVVGAQGLAVLGFAEHLFWPDDAQPFRYGGALAHPSLPARIKAELAECLRLLGTHCGLRGLCGVDFVLGPSGDWQLIEINPRPTATFDLLAHAGDAFRAHLAACRGRRLPQLRTFARAHAHAILYAPSAFDLVKSIDWPDWISDRPPAGSRFVPGAPVCTVRAAGGDADSARLLLHQRLHHLREALGLEDRSLPNPRTTR